MAEIKVNVDALKTGRDWVRHKIQDGSNVFRILPPFGDPEVHNNYPFRRWVIAWLVDPSSGKRLPFASPFSLGGQDTKCPVYEYSKALAEKIDRTKNKMKEKGYSDDQIKDKLAKLNKVAWEIRLQKTFAYNAVDKSGKVGLLELKKTAHDEMKKMMLEYIQDFEMDPTSFGCDIKADSGVWFNIKREGKGKDTKYSVDFNRVPQKTEDGDVVFKNDRSPLVEGTEENYSKTAYDLFSIYRQKTYEELKEILDYNLDLIKDEVPEAILPGFGSGSSVVAEVVETVDETAETKSKPKVAISLTDDDDDLDLNTAPKKSVKKVESTDDIMSMADDIFGD